MGVGVDGVGVGVGVGDGVGVGEGAVVGVGVSGSAQLKVKNTSGSIKHSAKIMRINLFEPVTFTIKPPFDSSVVSEVESTFS